jgi:hypothetical protein
MCTSGPQDTIGFAWTAPGYREWAKSAGSPIHRVVAVVAVPACKSGHKRQSRLVSELTLTIRVGIQQI